jgi:hypothetical protein
MDITMLAYRLPTIPYDLITAVNRAAAATGSTGLASATHRAGYNGHRVLVAYYPIPKIWTAEYIWAGRVVLARGSFENCLDAALSEYRRGALGTSVTVEIADDDLDHAQMLMLARFLPAAEALAQDATWQDARYAAAFRAVELERRRGIPATTFLIQSATIEEFEAKLEADSEERVRANRAMWQRAPVRS